MGRPAVIVARYLGLVKFEHTLFAMPFAMISLLAASNGRPGWRILFWVLVAMVGARSAAMAFNRLVDRRIDALNPRTSGRHLPTGAVSVAGARIFTAISSAVFVYAASRLNTLCFALSPAALAAVFFYSLTKRFTPFAHLFLGLGLGIAPIGAWLAVKGGFAPFPLWTCAGVLFWVAGFDTIYACQDVDFDRSKGLHSLASRFGKRRALWIARGLHGASIVCLWIAFSGLGIFGPVGLAGIPVMAAFLIWEHVLIKGGDLSQIDKAFFTINSWAGIILFLFVSIDVYMV